MLVFAMGGSKPTQLHQNPRAYILTVLCTSDIPGLTKSKLEGGKSKVEDAPSSA